MPRANKKFNIYRAIGWMFYSDPRKDGVGRIFLNRYTGTRSYWEKVMVTGDAADRLAALVALAWTEGNETANAQLLAGLWPEASKLDRQRKWENKVKRNERFAALLQNVANEEDVDADTDQP